MIRASTGSPFAGLWRPLSVGATTVLVNVGTQATTVRPSVETQTVESPPAAEDVAPTQQQPDGEDVLIVPWDDLYANQAQNYGEYLPAPGAEGGDGAQGVGQEEEQQAIDEDAGVPPVGVRNVLDAFYAAVHRGPRNKWKFWAP
jgi:hypothetical protein